MITHCGFLSGLYLFRYNLVPFFIVMFSGSLKGVMRVGVLAKGLLLHERLDVDLVVLCHGEFQYFSC